MRGNSDRDPDVMGTLMEGGTSKADSDVRGGSGGDPDGRGL